MKWQFMGAVVAGIIYGLASGFGLPFVSSVVFPKIFNQAEFAHFSEEVREELSGEQMAALTEEMDKILTPEQRKELGWSEDPDGDVWMLFLAVAALPLSFGVRGIAGFTNVYWINYCGVRVLETIRCRIFSKLQVLPLSFFQKNQTGELVSRVVVDTTQLQNGIIFVANDLIKQPVTFIGAMGALLFLSLRQNDLAFILLCLLTIPIAVLPIRYVGRKMLKKARLMQDEAGDLTGILSENLSAPREVRAFNLKEREEMRFFQSVRKLFKHQMKVVKYGHVLTPSIEFISAVGIAIAIFYAAKRGVTLEQVVPLIFALYMSYDPIKKLGMIHSKMRQATASLERIEYILNSPTSVPDPENPEKFVAGDGQIDFEDVSFSYQDTPTLEKIDLQIPGGQVVALVGPSGAGKSTFANLVSRFYDVNEGTIRIGGSDLRKIAKAELYESIALVSQDPVLFNDTIGENIRIGRQDATQEEIEEAARNAFADEFIAELENGYDTVVGEKGTRLSGGQKQRIALARAFLRNAPILILDEATSALDSESEQKIQKALDRLLPGKTAIVIAHRFSTIRSAGRILVFENGKIIADGPHDKVYAECALYRDLYDKQA
ncbi:MAG: ABC transporter ATP-binding protein [Verrucomicrobiota bacterium]